MPEAANVRSLDALRDFRAALILFIDKAKRSVTTAEAEVFRCQNWVGHEQLLHWRHEIRRGDELLSQAKSELFRATISQPDNPRGPTDQLRLVANRKKEIAHAQEKLKKTHHWTRVLEHENHEFRSAMSPLAGSLESDLPKAIAKIDNAISYLERYITDRIKSTNNEPLPIEVDSIAQHGEDEKDSTNEHGNCQGPASEGDEESPSQVG